MPITLSSYNFTLDGIFLAVAALIIVICTFRGFFRTLIHFTKFIFSVILAYLLGGKVAGLFVGMIEKPIHDSIYEKINGIYLGATESFNVETILEKIPKFLINQDMKDRLNGMTETGENLVQSVTDALSSGCVSIVSTVLGYLAVFVVSLILLTVAAIVLGRLIKKFKFIKRIDRVLGAAFGLVFATVLLTVAASLLAFFCQDQDFYTQAKLVPYLATSPVAEHISFLNFRTLIGKLFNR